VIKGRRQSLAAKISIIDNGPGIPVELKDTIFYPMVSNKQNGSGLGLSIAQTLTDHHNGKIDLESFPGYTDFSLYIPIGKSTKQKDSQE
jgi:two-component system nitrogen regulation sensor histidine kinase GlnL